MPRDTSAVNAFPTSAPPPPGADPRLVLDAAASDVRTGDIAGISGARFTALLLSRLVLFAVVQLAVAGVLSASGVAASWKASAAWWPLTASATNLLSLMLLWTASRSEGFALCSFYRPSRPGLAGDLKWTLAATLVGGALATGTSLSLSAWLFGSIEGGLELLVQPLPRWAALAGVLFFPITTALAELPTYYGYLQPRLARLTSKAWLIVVLPALLHALQHATLPLMFDARFLVWRGLMFLPFALLLAWALRRRPTLLPYLVVIHFLLDLQAALGVLAAAGT